MTKRNAGKNKISEEQTRRIASLARLRLSSEEAASLTGELEQILGWIDQLDELDTGNLPPWQSASTPHLPPKRPAIKPKREAILKNAPRARDGFFCVPRTVE